MKTDLPPSIRVIGFGKLSAYTVAEVNSLDYDGISAEMYSEKSDISPTVDDIMVIILGNPNSERVRSLAKTFYDADVLTLVVMNRSEKIPSYCIDAYTVVEQEKEFNVIRSLVEPIFTSCQISFDLYDLKLTLANMKQFLVLFGTGQGRKRIADAIANAMSGIMNNQKLEIERLSILLYHNSDESQPLTMEEMSALPEFIKSLPESIEVIWGLFRDEAIEVDQCRITVIAAGKNLKL